MKRIGLLLILSFGLLSFQSEKRPLFEELTFQPGEVTTYRLHYGWINAGEATVSVAPHTTYINGQKCFKLKVFGKTTGVANTMFNVRDSWESYVDTKSLLPLKSKRNIREGRYYLDETVRYENNRANVLWNKKDKVKKTDHFEIPNNVYDIVSGYYFLRNIDYSKLKPGERITIKAFFDDELYDFTVIYKGKETIKTKLGKVRAIKLVPSMPNNEVFEDGEESLFFWLSDDKNKIPLKVKAEMFIGAVEVDIKSYKGLKYNLNIVK